MHYKMVPVKNVMRLSIAGNALINRPQNMPGMGVTFGETGFGKTTAVTWFVNQCRGVYVRALATWSPSTMLSAILKELDEAPKSGKCAEMVNQIVEKISISGRPLFVDEADYVVESKQMAETLRDLHDMTEMPVILIGMAGIRRKISLRQQLSGRIAQWVEFKPCDIQDARLLAEKLSEIKISDELMGKLHKASGGSVRLLVVGLSHIEQMAKARTLKEIGCEEWGNENFFFGEAPKAREKNKEKGAEA